MQRGRIAAMADVEALVLIAHQGLECHDFLGACPAQNGGREAGSVEQRPSSQAAFTFFPSMSSMGTFRA